MPTMDKKNMSYNHFGGKLKKKGGTIVPPFSLYSKNN